MGRGSTMGAVLLALGIGACDIDIEEPFDSDQPWIDCSSLGEIDCSGPAVRYVDGTVESSGDGLSWDAAFASVQEGVNQAHCASEECGGRFQVWVAAGTYGVYRTTGDNTVRLRRGVDLYGGFAGGEADASERDAAANETVLDGEELVCHVVTGADDAAIDGFSIARGRAESPYDESDPSHCSVGGGMLAYSVSPMVSSCVFRDNRATFGAGLYAFESSAAIDGCVFEGNRAVVDGGGLGCSGGSLSVSDGVFAGNEAGGEGGGAGIADDATPEIERCLFDSNEALHGGGVGIRASSPAISSCVFFQNEADLGAGVGSEEGAAPTVAGCTFCANAAATGGGAMGNEGAAPSIHNSVFWGDSPDEISSDESSDVLVRYSVVEGGDPLFAEVEAVSHSDPAFVDEEAGDLRIGPGSPCVDAADGTIAPDLDFDGNARVDDPAADNTGVGPPWADIGAYELQP